VRWAFGHDNSYKAEVEREAKEMKWLALVIISGLAVGLLLLAGTAEGKATRISFTEEASCWTTSLGTGWTLRDGNLHIRGWTMECGEQVDLAGIPPLVGTRYEVINVNMDATGSGRIWVSWRIEVEGGGWEGIANGTVTGMLSEPSGTFGAVAHGTGIYEGQQYFSEGVIIDASMSASTGYILVP